MSLNYVIWNVTPQIIDFGKFEIRYYSLLFALGFIIGYFILLSIFKKQGLGVDLLDKLTVYMIISTIAGARIGHCLFYEFDYYIQHPLEIILPWRGSLGNDFEFTGFQGLASHGAAIGILIGIYFFARKTKSSYLWTMDMIVIVTALAGASIRLGNLMNSEIYGKPTQSTSGFVFTNDLAKVLTTKYKGNIDEVTFEKTTNASQNPETGVTLLANIHFNHKIKDEQKVKQFGDFLLAEEISRYNFDNNIFLLNSDSISYQVHKEKKDFILSAKIGGLPRYPTQIYEAISYLLIFVVLLAVFYFLGQRRKDGFIFGIFLMLLFAARFLIEFIKEDQESFEKSMALNMGQILSIPFIICGIALLIRKWPNKEMVG